MGCKSSRPQHAAPAIASKQGATPPNADAYRTGPPAAHSAFACGLTLCGLRLCGVDLAWEEGGAPAADSWAAARASRNAGPPVQGVPVAALPATTEAAAKGTGEELYAATHHDDAAAVRQLLARGVDNLEYKDAQGWTSLHWALVKDTEILKALLSAGANVDARDNEGCTALHWACSYGNPTTAQVLLASGATVDATTNDGMTPLGLAAGRGDAALVRALLEAGAQVERVPKGSEGDTAHSFLASLNPQPPASKLRAPELYQAAKQGATELVAELLAQGVETEHADGHGWTGFHWAADFGHTEVVHLLAEAGADKEARDKDGWTPLHWAAHRGRTEAALVLVKAGAVVDAAADNGMTSLGLAGKGRHFGVARALIEAGADAGRIPEGEECEARPFLSALADSLRTGRPMKASGRDLYQAAKQGETETVRSMLAGEVDTTEHKDASGWTGFHWAADYGHTEVVRLLAEAGADKEARDNSGWTPLHWAAHRGRTEAALVLAKAGAALDPVNEGELTPLAMAAAGGHTETARALIEAGADVSLVHKGSAGASARLFLEAMAESIKSGQPIQTCGTAYIVGERLWARVEGVEGWAQGQVSLVVFEQAAPAAAAPAAAETAC